MSDYDHNSEWMRRFADHLTLRDQLVKFANGRAKLARLERFMASYKNLVLGYIQWLLLRHKLVADELSGVRAAAEIWDKLMLALPGRITEEWVQGGEKFRHLLCEAVHITEHQWSHPNRPIRSVEFERARLFPDTKPKQEWLHRSRADILSKARQRLKLYEHNNRHKHNVYYTLFCIWDKDHKQPKSAILEQLNAIKGPNYMEPDNLRQTLLRMLDKFVRYLREGVFEWMHREDIITHKEYNIAFTQLDLVEYAMHSSYGRSLLHIDIRGCPV